MDVTQFYEAGADAGLTHSAVWSGSVDPINVLFTNGYNEVFDVAGNVPMARVPSVSVPSVAVGDTFAVNGTSYVIAAIRVDTPHTGETALMLRKA